MIRHALALQLRAAAVINDPTNTFNLLSTVRQIIPLVKSTSQKLSTQNERFEVAIFTH